MRRATSPRMNSQSHYLETCEKYRVAQAAINVLADQLLDSSVLIDQEIGAALRKHPERIKFKGLPHGSGVSLQAHLAPAATFDVKNCADAHLVADAILALTAARMRCTSAYERLSPSERSEMPSPSELIPSVL